MSSESLAECHRNMHNLLVKRKSELGPEAHPKEALYIYNNDISNPLFYVELSKEITAYRISVLVEGYKTSRGLTVGMPWRDVLKIYPKAFIKAGDGGIIGHISEPGIGIKVKSNNTSVKWNRIIDKPDQIPADTVIYSIFVYESS